MRSPAIRRIIQALIVGGVVALVLMATLPLIASNRIVRDHIAQELSQWTGYRVRLAAAPEIRLWPSFRARLAGVSFSEPGGDGATVLSADRMELRLSAMSALRGLVVFRNVDMVRPVFHLAGKDGRLALPEPPAGGQISRAIGAARQILAETPEQLDANRLPDIPFGSIGFTDGRVVVDEDGRLRDIVTSISGRLDWPTLARGGRLDASGIWNGETVKLSVNSSQALYLLAGGDAPVELRAETAIGNAVFSGNITLARSPFFNGHANLSSPSLGRVLEWSGLHASPAPRLGELSLTGAVVGDVHRLKIENAEMAVEGSEGAGALELSLADMPKRLTGTLAFQRLDLRVLLAAFGPIAGGMQFPARPIDMGFTDAVSVDLRLSAGAASAGQMSLTNLAAAAQVSPGFAAFDISDAGLFGGTIQASLRLDRKGDSNHAELRLNGRQLDTAILSQTAGINRILPIGRGDFSAMLKGSGQSWNDLLSSADGTIGSRFGPGNIPGLDIARLLERAEEGGFFPLSDAASGSTPIAGGEVRAQVRNGAIQVEAAQLRMNGDRTLMIRGLVPWMGQGLALTGRVLPSVEATAGTDLGQPGFFIGGSWLSPFVLPVSRTN